MGFFIFSSASGSWQEEGWLLICRCRCVRAAAGDCWVCGRCWREKAGRRPVAEDEEEWCPGVAVWGLVAHW